MPGHHTEVLLCGVTATIVYSYVCAFVISMWMPHSLMCANVCAGTGMEARSGSDIEKVRNHYFFMEMSSSIATYLRICKHDITYIRM